jgi:dolichol kinase
MEGMLSVLLCLAGVFALLAISEFLNFSGSHTGELRRKFTHITVGIFVASWPWLLTWRTIQFLGLAMLLVIFINRHFDLFRFNKGLRRETYGDYFFALAITVCALLTTHKVFFAIAVLQLALADGVAAVAGRKYGTKWKYTVFNHSKTVIGSMAFWFVSLGILGVGTLFAQDEIDANSYGLLIILAPPLLTIIENLSPQGLDNLLIPVAVLGALHTAAGF